MRTCPLKKCNYSLNTCCNFPHAVNSMTVSTDNIFILYTVALSYIEENLSLLLLFYKHFLLSTRQKNKHKHIILRKKTSSCVRTRTDSSQPRTRRIDCCQIFLILSPTVNIYLIRNVLHIDKCCQFPVFMRNKKSSVTCLKEIPSKCSLKKWKDG